MPFDQSPADALAVLRSRLRNGVRATPPCQAIMGWLCDHPTVPAVAEINHHGGHILLRLSDEPALEPLCSLLEFLGQVRTICQSLDMTEEQTRRTVAWAQRRLG